ncbi:DnaJ-domain-containing protein [Basidiobolus meristosporus CBS 931.73]|uniref:DnaJ-domain-containing protein n=1 Tax=Basidiobolus meristosporus CBS 931.73 TaxID=1314790 RepID=A0A1Y1WSI0_9FUNG|nr:DnaJ-domain-containing protein [Basidiobolus meristosporus CBS 931.73]|eukprot:ORX76501.1 DnaJ-domain-containing protein [Basidiobolus meristosporus CBS 931.73]
MLFRLVFVLLGWVLFGFLAYKASTTKIETNIWDPYEILGIDPGATTKQVKKHYKRLSLKWHPDKVSSEMAEEAESKFVEITKAYKVLTDDEIRKNYEEFGHPDGRQSMSLGIALPSWLVESGNSFFVLAIYGGLFGVLLPLYVGRWWYKSLRYTKDRILNQTMATYFKQLTDDISLRGMVDLLSTSAEFKEEVLLKPTDAVEVPKLIRSIEQTLQDRGEVYLKSKKYSAPYCVKAHALITAYINRVPVQDAGLAEDQQEIIKKSIHLVLGMLQISTAHSWLETSLRCMELSQMLVQALHITKPPILQLPYIDEETARAFARKKVRSVKHFVEFPNDERKLVLRDISNEKYENLMNVAMDYPSVQVPKAYFKVIGDDAITPGAIVTCVVKLNLTSARYRAEHPQKPSDENEGDVSDDEVDRFFAKKDADNLAPTRIHSPYFPLDKRPFWWVVICDPRGNRIILPPTKVSSLVFDKTETVKFQFQAPQRPGHYPFTVFVKSDSQVGTDIRRDIQLHVQDSSVLPPEEEIEDDISEPEEDSIAGQMAQLRAQQQGRGNNGEDTSDEE